MGKISAGRRSRLATGSGRQLALPLTALVLAALLSSTAFGTPSGASGPTTGGLRAEAASISARIATDNANLRSIGLAYLASQLAYHRDLASAAAIGRSLVTVRHSVTQERSQLQSAALNAYVGAGAQSVVGLYLVSEPDRVTSSDAYLGIAASELHSSLVALSGDEQLLATSLASEQHATAGARRALDASASARSSALATLGAEQSTLGSVSGQLASLVAAQAAAAERAAALRAAAVAAAAAAAAPTNSAASSTATSAGPPSTTSIGQIGPGSPPASLAGDFAAIRRCESGGNYALNSGNGYFGAYQFSASTWTGLGGAGLASSASPAAQDAAAYRLYQSSGWSAWPECAAIAGL